MTDLATIRVPKVLRDLVMRSARAEGLTAAEFLDLVTKEHDRGRRFAAVRAANAAGVLDPDYVELTEAWDQASGDGLATGEDGVMTTIATLPPGANIPTIDPHGAVPVLDALAAARARQELSRAAVRATRPGPQPRSLPRPGGPSGWELLRTSTSTRRDITELFAQAAREFPRIAHTQIRREHIYFLNHPETVLAVLHSRQRDTIKGRALQRTKGLLGEGLLTSEGAAHLRARRLVQPAFHHQRISAYAESMVAATTEHLDRWQDGRRLDLAADLGALTLDIVGRTLFGADLRGQANEVGAALADVLAAFPRMLAPGADLMIRLGVGPARRMENAVLRLDTLVDRLVAEHQDAGDTGDLLSMLVAARDGGTGFTANQLRDEAMTLVLAGHETTAMLLTWTLFLLARNPLAMTELRTELDDVLGTREVAAADLPSLPYTSAVLAESLRLYPPAWTLGRRLTADIEVDGWTLPRGSQVMASQWVLHRDPRWWDSALAFRPQRWITSAGQYDENAPGQPRGAWFPFGWGTRRCVGDSFALTEGAVVLATLARSWSVIPRPAHPVRVQAAVTLRPAGGMPVTLLRRR